MTPDASYTAYTYAMGVDLPATYAFPYAHRPLPVETESLSMSMMPLPASTLGKAPVSRTTSAQHPPGLTAADKRSAAPPSAAHIENAATITGNATRNSNANGTGTATVTGAMAAAAARAVAMRVHGHTNASLDYYEIPSPAESDDMQLDNIDISLNDTAAGTVASTPSSSIAAATAAVINVSAGGTITPTTATTSDDVQQPQHQHSHHLNLNHLLAVDMDQTPDDSEDHLDSTVASTRSHSQSHSHSQHLHGAWRYNRGNHHHHNGASTTAQQQQQQQRRRFDFSILRAFRRFTMQQLRDDPPSSPTPSPSPSPSPSLTSPISSPTDTPTLFNGGVPDRERYMHHLHPAHIAAGTMPLQPLHTAQTAATAKGAKSMPTTPRAKTAGGGTGGAAASMGSGAATGGGGFVSGLRRPMLMRRGGGGGGAGILQNNQQQAQEQGKRGKSTTQARDNKEVDPNSANAATVCKIDNLRPFVMSRQREAALINRVRDVALSADNDYVGIADSFWVLASLRARNGDMHRAIALLTNYLAWRRSVTYHDRLCNGVSSAVCDLLRTGTFSVCGNCSVDGQPVLTIRYEYYEPAKHQIADVSIAFTVLVEYLMRRFPRCQTHGLVVMEEMSGAKVANLDIRVANFLSRAFSSMLPLRIAAMFFCNAKRGVRTALRFMSPFLAKKFKTRVYVMHEGVVERFATFFASDQTPTFMKMHGSMVWSMKDQHKMAWTVARECQKWPKASTFRDSQ